MVGMVCFFSFDPVRCGFLGLPLAVATAESPSQDIDSASSNCDNSGNSTISHRQEMLRETNRASDDVPPEQLDVTQNPPQLGGIKEE